MYDAVRILRKYNLCLALFLFAFTVKPLHLNRNWGRSKKYIFQLKIYPNI